MTIQSASITMAIHEECELLKKAETIDMKVDPSAPLWLSMVPRSGLTPKFWNTPQSMAI